MAWKSFGVYEAEVRECLDSLGHVLDVARAKLLWQAALNTSWHQTSLWVHGDFASGNILLHHGRLVAVIDFGCVAVGDPACDLVIAWTLLSREARELFKNHVHMDQGTWTRARGWALWKAMLCLRRLEGFSSKEAQSHKRVIEAVLSERLD